MKEIFNENNYYPFGLKHKGYNNAFSGNVNSVATKFGYNGKELNDELGLEWLDFGARNYDASLGRWMNLDPLAELMRRHSPYNYAFDNPVYFIDPDGMAPEGVVDHYGNDLSASAVSYSGPVMTYNNGNSSTTYAYNDANMGGYWEDAFDQQGESLKNLENGNSSSNESNDPPNWEASFGIKLTNLKKLELNLGFNVKINESIKLASKFTADSYGNYSLNLSGSLSERKFTFNSEFGYQNISDVGTKYITGLSVDNKTISNKPSLSSMNNNYNLKSTAGMKYDFKSFSVYAKTNLSVNNSVNPFDAFNINGTMTIKSFKQIGYELERMKQSTGQVSTSIMLAK